jgi:uncharacterized protein (DUF2141 family)
MRHKLMTVALLLPVQWACVASAGSPEREPSPSDSLSSELSAASKDSEVVVTIEGFRNEKGQALVSLFASSKGFPDKAQLAAIRKASGIEGDVVEVSLGKVVAGTYAVAILHDEDMDFELRTGLLGIPKEGIGFSNNAKGRFGPPSFGDARFKVVGPRVELRIKLVYY